MNYDELNRRAFLKKVTVLGSVVGGSTLIAACGGGNEGASDAGSMGGSESSAGASAASGGCNDLTGLTDQEISVRTTLQYVEVTENPDQNCLNCNFYSQEEGASCGACTLMKGPIAPNGWCASWVVKPA